MNFLLKISAYLKYQECPVLVLTLGKEIEYSLYQVKKKKDDIESDLVIDKATDLALLSDKKYQLQGKPLVLSLHGEGVVQRVYKGNVEDLNSVIPNINLENYYLQSSELDSEKTFVSLLRLETLEKIVHEINELGLLVSNVDLGFRSIIEYTNALTIKEDYLLIGSQYLQLDQGCILETGKRSKLEEIDKLPVSNISEATKSAALAVAIDFFLNSIRSKGSQAVQLLNNHRELVAAKINSLILRYVLPVLMGLLFINFFIFENVQEKINLLSADFDGISELSLKIDHLKKQLNDENDFQYQVDLNSIPHFAWFIDRISSKSIPGIRFSEFQINPLKKKIRKDEMIEYYGGDLIIKGITESEDCFSQFLVNLDQSKLGMKIEKQVYFYDKTIKKAKFEVMLKVVKGKDVIMSSN